MIYEQNKGYFMFVMVFVGHILWGGNCIQRQKNTGMIGVSFSKSVSKVRINVCPKVCFTATIPYMAENSTMEIIYTPAFRFAHLWLTSPGGTCNSDEVGLGALQFLEGWRL